MGAIKKEAEQVIKKALIKTKGVTAESLKDETTFSELDMKSTNFVHVINDLEEEFELEIPFMEFRRKATIEKASQFIEELIES